MQTNNPTLTSSVIELRRKVLKGGFASSSLESIQTWKYLRAKLLVFVSSTFTDTYRERNVLLEKIMPLLREEGLKNDIEVTFVDMRWGVRDENTLDHLTWIACCNELERCRVESTSLFFLSLQSDKYGYMPIPKYILQTDYEVRYNLADKTVQEIADLWYKLDNNAIPPVYTLKQLDSISDSDYWDNVLPKLRQMLSEIPFDRPHSDDLVVNRSVTEWETKYGLLQDASLPRCIWLHRHFKGGITDKSKQDPRMLLFDAHDSSTRNKLENLKAWMLSRLSSNPLAIIKNCDITVDSYNEENDDWSQYLSDWEKNTSDMLFTELNRILEFHKKWSENGNGIGIDGFSLREMLHHYEWAHEKCQSFAGRDVLLNDAVNNLNLSNNSDDNMSDDKLLPEDCLISKHHHSLKKLPKVYSGNYGCDICGQAGSGTVYHCDECGFDVHPKCVMQDIGEKQKTNKDFSGISFFVSGTSGSGKTALLSKIAELFYNNEIKAEFPRPVIVRFCGTSGGSVDGFGLVQSICHQILFISDNMHVPIPSDYDSVVRLFHELLKQIPIILLIDSLDQIDDRYLARSRISFLKGIQPHPNTRIILSTLPDGEDSNFQSSDFYGPQTCLRASTVREIIVPPLDSNTDDVQMIVESILRLKERTITPEQFQLVREKSTNEPSPLYLMLSSLIFTTFKSFDDISILNIQAGVENIVNQLFDNLERNYGKDLTRAALGYITFSVSGIGDIEMEDLLSLNDLVLNKVFQYSEPGIRRLPVHVWLRIRSELKGLVFTRGNGCLSWYHRQIKTFVENRYTIEEKKSLQAIMGNYFGGLVDVKTATDRKISVQLLSMNDVSVWFPSSKINIRRCTEAPLHLVRSELFEESINQICNMEMICACCKTGLGFDLLETLIELSTKIKALNSNSISSYSLKKLQHFYRWLKYDLTAIKSSPAYLMSGACTASQPKSSLARREIERIVDLTRQLPTEQSQNSLFSSDSWVRNRSLGSPVESDSIIYNLIGHKSSIVTVDISLDGKKLVSSSVDDSTFVWDIETGSISAILELSPKSSILCVRWDITGVKIFTGCRDGSLNVFNSKTGAKLASALGHSGKILSLCWSLDYDLFASGGDDKNILIWDSSSLNIINSLSGSTQSIISMSWSVDRNFICSCDDENSFHVWDISQSNCKTNSSGHSYGLRNVSWCPNKVIFATASDDTTIGIWNMVFSGDDSSILKIRSLQGHTDVVYCLCWCSDGDRLASGGRDQSIRIWHVASGEILNIFDGNISPIMTVLWDNINSTVISGSADGKLTAWDISIGNMEETKLTDIKKGVYTVSWSGDEEKIASGHEDGMIFIWSANSNVLITSFTGHMYTVYCVSWSHNNENLASCSSDKTVKLWSVLNRCLLYSFSGYDATVWSIAWSPDDSYLLSGAADCNGNLRIWNVSKKSVVVMERVDFITSVAWSNCGKSLYIGFYNGALINYDSSDLSIISIICPKIENNGVHLIYSIALSKSGDNILTSNNSGEVVVWDINNGAVTKNKQFQHRQGVRSAVWTPCDSKIITACYDHFVRLWNVQDGNVIATLSGHNDKVMCVASSPSGCYIVSGSSDKTVRIWDSVSLESIKNNPMLMSNKNISNRYSIDTSQSLEEDILVRNKNNIKGNRTDIANLKFSESIENLSLFKPARMSSQHTQFHPGNAVDGNLDTFCHTHNSQGFTPHWWEVSIDLSKVISIKIHNRGNCQRLRDITITFHHLNNIIHTSNMLNKGNILSAPAVIEYEPDKPIICDRIRITRYPDPGNKRQIPNGSDERSLDRQLILSISNVVVNGYCSLSVDNEVY